MNEPKLKIAERKAAFAALARFNGHVAPLTWRGNIRWRREIDGDKVSHHHFICVRCSTTICMGCQGREGETCNG